MEVLRDIRNVNSKDLFPAQFNSISTNHYWVLNILMLGAVAIKISLASNEMHTTCIAIQGFYKCYGKGWAVDSKF